MTAANTAQQHGTPSSYKREMRLDGEACETCKQANRDAANDLRARRRAARAEGRPLPDHVEHGTVLAYKDYGCRCDPCTDANAARARDEYVPKGTTT